MDYSLQFDGSQNYLSLGTMGNFGSNLGNGFYCKFLIRTTSTDAVNSCVAGCNNSGTATAVLLLFNQANGGSASTNNIRVFIRDNSNRRIDCGISTPSITLTDGKSHIVEVIWTGGSATIITLKIDGVSQTLTYTSQNTLSGFSNFTPTFTLGARNNNGTIGAYYPCILDNFKIGTSSAVLYGDYGFNEGTGTTTQDASGNSNTGTLSKGAGAYPIWYPGLSWKLANSLAKASVKTLNGLAIASVKSVDGFA